MKKRLNRALAILFAFFSSIFGSTPSLAETVSPFVVVSDIDDTIKITCSYSLWKTVGNLFHGTDVYSGVEKLYQHLSKRAKNFFYLSAMPQSFIEGSWFAPSIETFLFDGYHFPQGDLIFSNWYKWEKVAHFKGRELAQLVTRFQEPFLLLGDDRDKDPEVFEEFLATQGQDRVANLYIHRVRGRQLPEHVIPYSTYFEVALHEFEQGHLDAEEVSEIGNSVLQTQESKLLFPDGVFCPKDYTLKPGEKALLNPNITSLAIEVQHYVRGICGESQ